MASTCCRYLLVSLALLTIALAKAEYFEKNLGSRYTGLPPKIIDSVPDSAPNPNRDYTSRVTATKPDNLPADEQPKLDDSLPEDGMQMVDLDMAPNKDGGVDMYFKSHGREQSLHLKDSRMNLGDIPVQLVGGDEDVQANVQDQMKNIRMMRDTKRGASIAVQFDKDGAASPIMKGGFFNFGNHQFNLKEHRENSSRAFVERAPLLKDKLKGQFTRDKVMVKRNVRDERRRSKRASATITPINAIVELAMVIDYSVYEFISNADNVTAESVTDRLVTTILYFAHMAEMMDDHYQTMQNSDIAIAVELTEIAIIVSSSELSDLVEAHKYVQPTSTYIDSSNTLTRLVEWYGTSSYNSTLYQPNDHVMLFTAYDMYDESDGSTGTVGLAWTGTICDKTGYSSSLVEIGYLMTYDASTAAHELGHSLGALHDGQDGSSAACSDDNFVMAAYSGNDNFLENRFLFGCCSQRSFYGTIAESGSCLIVDQGTLSNDAYTSYTQADIENNIANNLPGQIFSADDQCYVDSQTDACGEWVYIQEAESICLNLWCRDPTNPNRCIQAYTAAADGTTCDTNKWCYQGECVTEGDVYTALDQNCDVSACYGNETKCTDGVNVYDSALVNCYQEDSKCDGFNDCSDGSDEGGSCDFRDICPFGFTKCSNGFTVWDLPSGISQLCIHDEWKCDGGEDCSDGSDEVYCDGECFLCNSGVCVASTDGVEACNNCSASIDRQACIDYVNFATTQAPTIYASPFLVAVILFLQAQLCFV